MQRFQQIRQVLGSEALLTLVLPDANRAGFIFESLWSQIDQFETSFSRFLPDSELSKFNREAGKATAISPEFQDFLITSYKMSQKTNGLFNPFVLPALQRSGYLGSWPKTETSDPSLDHRNREMVTQYNQLITNQSTAKIPKNSALDLGGIGKGYLLDQLSSYLEKQNVQQYWLSLGGDIICDGLDLDDKPWVISVSDALSPENTIDHISNDGRKMAIATSGIVKRQGKHNGKKWHHLIDPETGKPASTNVLTATVCAKSAVVADVIAKCLVIGGSSKSKDVKRLLPISSALLQLRPR